jgi:hypothetical protein
MTHYDKNLKLIATSLKEKALTELEPIKLDLRIIIIVNVFKCVNIAEAGKL